MSASETRQLIESYYKAFNALKPQEMTALVSDDIEHRVNEGAIRLGKEKFAEFGSHMGVSYREELKDIEIFVNADGSRAAAEFIVHGEYLQTDPGLPEAKGQKYILPAGAFFEVKGGKIARVTVFYNLNDWIAQVSA
ncbi:ketosteroid isomerase-related protein [Pseudogemmobacter faecipullorum]|uniref:Nuclear transport factor 2 family protein n=1 Tax=Pseudogemmobacter faecipullorum TaxID=2755041 RepID=A0ABS8CMD5_9RHOB|nr:ketosteroid isomerase-related protein [Pseudogemmobacter faecipullorum]MCB5410534.1 nuclear transport factor 2 family protein [Pseudogemmobacter faecipullorum]